MKPALLSLICRRRGCRGITWLIVIACGLSACAPAVVPTPTLTATAVIRPTLPPTWTPTPTYTDVPPLPTATLTPAPTITPILAAATICNQFSIDTNLDKRRILASNMHITMLVQSPVGVTVRFLATNDVTHKNRGVDIPGADMTGFQLAVSQLPGSGQYDWTVSVHTDAYGDICQRKGWFIAAGQESTRAEEAEIR